MDSETIDAVTDWETVPAEDGYRGLHALVDAEFTGAVTDGRTWAFALNGRVIGVFEGDVEAFEGAALTAYESPDPALPLLYAMRERGGETQAKYYTQQMALSEADETLRSGGFTGYVRLSENVLSGDYYVVYHGGKSMSVAFVGNSRRLLTGDEAFERANDEVGIYEVVDADVDVVDLPDVPEAESKSEPASDATVESETDEATATRPDADATTGAVDADSDAEIGGDAEAADEAARNATFGGDDSDADEGTDDAPTAEPTTASDADPVEPAPVEADVDATSTDDADDSAADAPSEPATASEPPEAADHDPADAVETSVDSDADDRPHAAAPTDDADVPDDDVFSEEEEWREARAIPSLDPAQTEVEERSGGTASQRRSDAARRGATVESKTRSGDDASAARQRRPPSPPQSVSRSSGGDTDSDTRSSGAPSRSGRADSNAESSPASESEATDDDADLRERLAEATAARERLESERDELETERDEYREEAERLASEVNALEAEIERLESALADASASASAGDGSDAPDRTMAAAEALSGTNLFVRYASKADPTLEDAHGGDARRDEVNDNLRVEHHTQFDTDGLRVEGRPFEEYLRDTTEYRFVEWVVRDLLYDVQATRARSELGDLYDAIPRVDRAEIGGTVSADVGESGDADGDEAADAGRETAFDVVLWDGRGNPLLVANLNTSRDPATESMVTSLISDASAVGEGHDTLGAAFYVTASYFEPGALDAVGDATGGGLLSRSKRRSYVKLARKQGFHLCLVEARNREFHVSVPDL